METRFGLRTAKNLLFDHIDKFQFLVIFWVPNLSYLPVLQEGTTAEFAALGSSHNCPWVIVNLNLSYRNKPAFSCVKNSVWRKSHHSARGRHSSRLADRYSQTARTAKMCQNVFNLL